MTNQQKEELQRFISTWSHQGKEVGDKETYWNTLLRILGVPQAILDTRAKYPDSSLADLYDPLTMPIELRKAHEANDKAVLNAYGLKRNASESEIVACLFKMYEKLTAKDS